MRNTFSPQDLDLLRSFIGSQLSFVAGPDLWEPLSADLIFVVCGERGLELRGDIFQDSFEGFESDYSKINFSEITQSEVLEATQRGFRYLIHAGELVTGVAILRNQVKHSGKNGNDWDYTSDSGVIFYLSEGALAVTKLGHHDELLQVTYQEKIDEALAELNSHFESDFDDQYEFTRVLVPLSQPD